MDASPTFMLFGASHVVTIGVIGAVAIGLPVATRRLEARSSAPSRLTPGRLTTAIAWSLAALLLTQEAGTILYRYLVLGDPWRDNLPFHLCDLGLLIGAYTLIRRDRRAFQLLYYWGLAGTLQAILTPDIAFGFPDLRYLVFFIGHGLVIVSIGYAAIALDLRPTLRGTAFALLAANLWALVVAAPVNLLLGTNYLYLCHKPAQASLMDALGPWPWYLLALEVVGLVSFLVYYAPWAIGGRLRKRGTTAS